MKVLVITQGTFAQAIFTGVTKLEYDGTNYTITYGSETKTYSADIHKVFILW